MLGSKLPMPVLGKIWDLSDVDRDGFLDRYEFTVSMHLVFRVLQGDKCPDELPPELKPDKVPKSLSAMPNLNGTPKVSVIDWPPIGLLFKKYLSAGFRRSHGWSGSLGGQFRWQASISGVVSPNRYWQGRLCLWNRDQERLPSNRTTAKHPRPHLVNTWPNIFILSLDGP